MNETNQKETTSMSMSQKRRLERKLEAERKKRQARLTKLITYTLITVISISVIAVVGYKVYRNVTRIKPSSDFSAYINDDGLIKDVTATDIVELADYKNIKVPLSEVEYSDESVEKDIQTILKSHSELSKDTDAVIKDGDKVNIDYVGTVDGVEFEGGNTNGEGTDLEIGAGQYVDDFEQQLIGHGIGDNVTIEVTFPSDYSLNPDLASKDAVFEVVVNGIYVAPEFTDEFVQENLSDKASTADEYREYVRETNYDKNLTKWIEDYLMNNSTISSYPKKYFNHLKATTKYQAQSGVEYMNQIYASMGSNEVATFEDVVGMSEPKYDASLADEVKEPAKKALIYQAIYEKEGLTVTKDDYGTYFDEKTSGTFDTKVASQGTGYVMQQILDKKVLEYVKGLATVE